MPVQDKDKEKQFFASHAADGEYNVFTDASNHRLIRKCLELGQPVEHGTIVDLGCGSGIFTFILRNFGYRAAGLDLSHNLTCLGKSTWPEMDFITGDIEFLPFADNSLDAVLLSGVVHHFPDVRPCAREVARILRPGGVFMAFDPNRRNPFMWLYRDRDSPLYSNKGVTANERPVLAEEIAKAFADVGFVVRSDFLSGLSYRYIASPAMRLLLPIYNTLDAVAFTPAIARRFRSFVLTAGTKQM